MPDVKATVNFQFLYDLTEDPYQLNNLATISEYLPILNELSALLIQELEGSEDPLMTVGADAFSQSPYYGAVNSQ